LVDRLPPQLFAGAHLGNRAGLSSAQRRHQNLGSNAGYEVPHPYFARAFPLLNCHKLTRMNRNGPRDHLKAH
jgi:hypothetical protein